MALSGGGNATLRGVELTTMAASQVPTHPAARNAFRCWIRWRASGAIREIALEGDGFMPRV